MQGVGNTIKIAFFCLYSKATPFKIPARGVILHLTPFPLFITLHFSSLCEEGKVRKLQERLDCVCERNKESVASNTIWEGTQRERELERLTDCYVLVCRSVCVSACVCVSTSALADANTQIFTVCEPVYSSITILYLSSVWFSLPPSFMHALQ